MDEKYLNQLKALMGKKVHVFVDRPLGSTHPKHASIIYKVNYGYIKELVAPDNEYQDVYILGIGEPLDEYEGIIIAIIKRLNDNECKLVVAPVGKAYREEEIREKVAFQEQYFKIEIILK